MDYKLFILSILLLSINFFLLDLNNKEEIGSIESIYFSNNRITINLEESNVPLILFTEELLNLKKGDKIIYFGKKNIYKNKEQIIVSKIIKYQQQ